MTLAKNKVVDIISMCLMVISSITIPMSAYVSYDSMNPIVRRMSYLSSAIFWVSIVSAWMIKLILLVLIKRKQTINGKPAIFTFFSNKAAIIADIIMFILLLAMIVIMFTKVANIVKLISISLFILAFQMHIALNGKVYKYIYS